MAEAEREKSIVPRYMWEMEIIKLDNGLDMGEGIEREGKARMDPRFLT